MFVPREEEEILNDPGNYAILRHLASKNRVKAQEVSSDIGISHERIKLKSSILEDKGLLGVERKGDETFLNFSEEHRENLEGLKDLTEGFLDEHSESIDEKLEDEYKSLEKIREELRDEKEGEISMKEEKKIKNQISMIENVLEDIEDEDKSVREKYAVYSSAHRLQILLGERDGDFHNFNLFRKLKTLEKAEKILSGEPEDESRRKFFGNRWVTSDSLEKIDG